MSKMLRKNGENGVKQEKCGFWSEINQITKELKGQIC